MTQLKQLLLRILRVPGEPDPPLGDPGTLRVFRAAPGFFRFRLAAWGLRQLGVLAGFVFFFGFDFFYGVDEFLAGLPEDAPGFIRGADGWAPPLFVWIELAAIAAFLVQAPITLLMTMLDYENRWYMMTDRSMRIREGLTHIREQTIMFANVQNVSIRQGPLQRLFGIEDLEVRTAGGGGGKQKPGEQAAEDKLHTGYFHGVANAAEIRDVILARLKEVRGAGLGHPEERRPQPSADRTLEAARLLLTEARTVRRIVDAA